MPSRPHPDPGLDPAALVCTPFDFAAAKALRAQLVTMLDVLDDLERVENDAAAQAVTGWTGWSVGVFRMKRGRLAAAIAADRGVVQSAIDALDAARGRAVACRAMVAAQEVERRRRANERQVARQVATAVVPIVGAVSAVATAARELAEASAPTTPSPSTSHPPYLVD